MLLEDLSDSASEAISAATVVVSDKCRATLAIPSVVGPSEMSMSYSISTFKEPICEILNVPARAVILSELSYNEGVVLRDGLKCALPTAQVFTIVEVIEMSAGCDLIQRVTWYILKPL